MSKKYVASACLLGHKCKYNGESNYQERLDFFQDLDILIPVCPEIMGGLPTPRKPSEITEDGVYMNDGTDVTSNFTKGAEQVLSICKEFHIKKAIFKERSPSCGVNQVYDGTFSSTKINGEGITTSYLRNNGIRVYSELDMPVYDAIILAAGISTRNNLKTNKILESSLDKTCIESSVEPFLYDYLCDRVIIVVNPSEINLVRALFPSERVEIVLGRDTREESMLQGLKLATSDYVLIHDGARPYIKEELVDSIVDSLKKNCAIVPFVVSNNPYDLSVNGKNIQTPQGYDRRMLVDICKKEDVKCFRDESSFVSKHAKITYIDGDESNTKLTDLDDIIKWRKYKDENIL